MKININRKLLDQALSTVSHALPGSNAIPVLQSIKITFDESLHPGQLKLTASDLFMGITQLAACDIQQGLVTEPGDPDLSKKYEILLPGKLFKDSIHSFAGETVEMIVNTAQTQITLRCGKSNFKLPTVPVEEYPEIKEPDGMKFRFPSGEIDLFKKEVAKVIYATLKDDPRPFATSVLLDFCINDAQIDEYQKGRMSLVATDANRLVIRELPVEFDPSLALSRVMLPANYLKKLADIAIGQLEFYVSEKKLFVTCKAAFQGDIMISIPIVEAQYPQYMDMVNGGDKAIGTVTVNREQFLEVLGRAALMAGWFDFKVNLDNDSPDNKARNDRGIAISNNNGASGGCGEFSESFPWLLMTGVGVDAKMNIKYMMEFLKSTGGAIIEIKYIHDQKPFYFTPQGDGAEAGLLGIIMPMKKTAENSGNKDKAA